MGRANQSVISPQLNAFLNGGAASSDSDEALAEQITAAAIRLTQTSVPAALKFSHQAVTRSRGLTGPVPLAAWRSLGRSALMGADYKLAEQAYQKSRTLVGRDVLSKGRIDRTLIDVYMYRGRFDRAEACARSARSIFRRRGDQAELAKVDVNQANLYHRLDRHLDAARLYRRAQQYFLSVGDSLSAARCAYNLANSLVQLFEFREAEGLYAESHRTYTQAGYELDALDARWGLSWLHLLEGKYHLALGELRECEAGYRAHGRQLRVATCVLDRAEIYLQLALSTDARLAAIEAERLCRKLHLRYESAKASLYRAMAAAGLGERAEARRALTRAETLFAKEGNTGFSGAASMLRADLAATKAGSRRAITKALSIFRRSQLPLWSAIADLRASEDEQFRPASLARLHQNPQAQQMPHLYAAWQTTLGDEAARAGNQRAALRHWRNAARRLDDVRALLPPLGMRQQGSKLRIAEPHRRLVRELASDHPAESIVWAERFRTAGLWQPVIRVQDQDPARQRVQAALAELAGEVARLSTQLYADGERAMTSAPAHRRMQLLQQRVRAELLHIERPEAFDRIDEGTILEEYFRAGKDQTVIHWHCADEELVALIVTGTEVRSVVLPRGRLQAERFLARLSFMLDSASLAASHHLSHDLIAEQQLLEQAGEQFWRPLELSSREQRILVIADGDIANLPWGALRLENQPMLRRHNFCQATSIRHWAASTACAPVDGGIQILTGRRQDLPAIEQELNAIRACFPQAQLIDPVRRRDLEELPSSWIWHYAGHALVNAENPFYSRLELVDGPLFAADLRLLSTKVDLVVLSACRAAEETAIPGDESTGFVRSFLEMGARNVIAGHWAVADKSAARWMSAFYREVAAGRSYRDAAHAVSLRLADEAQSCYHWGAFSLYGAGS